MRSKFLIAMLIGAPTAIFAAAGHDAPEIPKELATLNQLAGTWEGTTKFGDKEMPATVVYESTASGTALITKLFPGLPHEMTSVYHKEGKSVGMTHYCAGGNQPHMVLKKADGKVFSFAMDKPDGLTSPKENHMHAVTLTLKDPDTLVEEWISYDDGKPQPAKLFTFKRRK